MSLQEKVRRLEKTHQNLNEILILLSKEKRDKIL